MKECTCMNSQGDRTLGFLGAFAETDLDQRLLSAAFLLVHNCDVDENLVGNEEPIKSRLPEQSSSGRAVPGALVWVGLVVRWFNLRFVCEFRESHGVSRVSRVCPGSGRAHTGVRFTQLCLKTNQRVQKKFPYTHIADRFSMQDRHDCTRTCAVA